MVTTSRLVLFIGVVMIILGAFGVQPISEADLTHLGIGVAFAAGLV